MQHAAQVQVRIGRVASGTARAGALLAVLGVIGVLVGGLLSTRSPDLRDRHPVAALQTAIGGPKLELCGVGYVEPVSFQYPCTSTAELWLDLRWQSWKRSAAQAIGEYWSPGSAGQFASVPVRVRLTEPTGSGDAAVFTRLTVTFPGEAPDGSVGTSRSYRVSDGRLTISDPTS